MQNATREAGFIVPRFALSEDGRLVANGLTLETYEPGEKVTKDVLPQLQARFATFHGLSKDLPQRPGFASSSDLLEADRGGDIDLSQMPADLARLCRAAWEPFKDLPQAGLHGDLNPDNLLRRPDGAFVLLDWDEARVDAPLYDQAALLGRYAVGEVAWRAFEAWEVAVCWLVEPEHARRVARRLAERRR